MKYKKASLIAFTPDIYVTQCESKFKIYFNLQLYV